MRDPHRECFQGPLLHLGSEIVLLGIGWLYQRLLFPRPLAHPVVNRLVSE